MTWNSIFSRWRAFGYRIVLMYYVVRTTNFLCLKQTILVSSTVESSYYCTRTLFVALLGWERESKTNVFIHGSKDSLLPEVLDAVGGRENWLLNPPQDSNSINQSINHYTSQPTNQTFPSRKNLIMTSLNPTKSTKSNIHPSSRKCQPCT